MGRKKLDALLNAHYWALIRSCCKSKEGRELFAVFGQDTRLTVKGRIFMVETYLGGDHDTIAEDHLFVPNQDESENKVNEQDFFLELGAGEKVLGL